MKNLMTMLAVVFTTAVMAFSAQANNANSRVVYTSTGGECTANCMQVEAVANTIKITTFGEDGSIVRLETYNINEIRQVTNNGNGVSGLEAANGGGSSGLSTFNTTSESDDGTSSTTTFASFTLNGTQYVYETVTIYDADGNVVSQITTLYTRDTYVMVR